MKFILKEFSQSVISLNRYTKRLVAIITDVSLCIICTWLAFILRLDELILFRNFNFTPAFLSIILAIPIFWIFGLYRTIFRFTNSSIIFTISLSTFIYGIIYFLIISIYGIDKTPRTIGLIQPMILFFGIILSRLLVKYGLTLSLDLSKKRLNKKKALIYGAGNAGRQLLTALENSLEYKIVGFLDDDRKLSRQVLLGQYIYNIEKLDYLLKSKNINTVFLAMPSILKKKETL